MMSSLEKYMEYDIVTGEFQPSGVYSVHIIDGSFLNMSGARGLLFLLTDFYNVRALLKVNCFSAFLTRQHC